MKTDPYKAMKTYLSEPYRLFFPIGFLFAVWGIFLWISYVVWNTPYPGSNHSYLMIGGFLTSFTTGFLMTAVPRFTGTFHADLYEVLISLTSLFFLLFFGSNSIVLSSACLLVSHFNLIIFFLRRFLNKKTPLPEPFLFIPLSLLFSVLGHVLIISSLNNIIDSSYFNLGRSLSFFAFMLGLILGIGSKIIPMFNGFGPSRSRGWFLSISVPALFFSSFFIFHFYSVKLALLLRLLCISYVALFNWTIHRRPLNPSRLSFSLWVSCWGLLIGSIGLFLFPEHFIHWSHVIYIVGFGLMTLMIGSRVILSHGGFNLTTEGEHWHISLIMGSVLLAGLIRWSLFLFPDSLNTILMLSSIFWLIGLLFWWIRIGSKLLSVQTRDSGNHSAPN